jgi:hypothetical protein
VEVARDVAAVDDLEPVGNAQGRAAGEEVAELGDQTLYSPPLFGVSRYGISCTVVAPWSWSSPVTWRVRVQPCTLRMDEMIKEP